MPTGGPVTPAPKRGTAAVSLSVAALALSLVAVGLSGWTLLRAAPQPAAATSYTSSQQSDAKSRICAAADLVRRGITMNTNLPNPGGDGDVTGAIAIQANARLALSNGGQYLRDRMDPGTPSDLAAAVDTLADTLIDVGAGFTAGQQNTDPDQAARLAAADTENARVAELCK